MKVLIIFAHPNPMSFTKAILDNFVRGLQEAGHPLLKFKKAIIMHPTFFNEKVYREKGFKASMERTIDDWSLKYPGIDNVDHIYFHSILEVSAETRNKYLETAYSKGKDLYNHCIC